MLTNLIHADCKSLAPTWETLATDFANEPDVVIAKVDAEGENSKATAKAAGVTSFPTIKFYPKGSSTPEDYQGGRSEEMFLTYLNDKAGTHRTTGGGLDASAGTIDVLDDIVVKYTGGEKLSTAVDSAKAAAASFASDAQYKYAEYYLRVFDKLSKNDDYVSKELLRLDGILKKGGLAPSKLDELTSKTNILRRFINKVTGKDEL
jgi:protein disulfide-isomerase A6